ncbi:hypothetical protein NUW54_g4789 [Trametes sanguinea]|uniref:Uncharacterized protein n=1 Tax=Trametes sanguinea TaxID=158606 RepID=A0ACC1PX28_9APHY|nr:hypothetical protein NUW54_g4789 [Trametes sanguinea]
MAFCIHRVSYAAGLAFREFIPRQQDREPLTWTNAPNAFLYLIPYFFLAYLVRRQGTHLMRLLLLPTVIAMTLRCTFRYTKDDPSLVWYEWNRGTLRFASPGLMILALKTFLSAGLLAMFVMAKSIDFAFAREGRLKLGEKELRRSHDNDGSPRHVGKERAAELLGRSPAARFLPRSVFDAVSRSA